jgi:hypothetical protein
MLNATFWVLISAEPSFFLFPAANVANLTQRLNFTLDDFSLHQQVLAVIWAAV